MANIDKNYHLDQAQGPRKYYRINSASTAFVFSGPGILCEVISNKDATDTLILKDIGGATTESDIFNAIASTTPVIWNIDSTTFTQPTYPRPLRVYPGGVTTTILTGDVKITGTDVNGAPIVEYFSFGASASTPTNGSEFFNTVNEIRLPATEADTATFFIGTGEGSCVAQIVNARAGDKHPYFVELNQGLMALSGSASADYTITFIN